jgi:hypothetical protein
MQELEISSDRFHIPILSKSSTWVWGAAMTGSNLESRRGMRENVLLSNGKFLLIILGSSYLRKKEYIWDLMSFLRAATISAGVELSEFRKPCYGLTL